jgi:hypothetical protein
MIIEEYRHVLFIISFDVSFSNYCFVNIYVDKITHCVNIYIDDTDYLSMYMLTCGRLGDEKEQKACQRTIADDFSKV